MRLYQEATMRYEESELISVLCGNFVEENG